MPNPIPTDRQRAIEMVHAATTREERLAGYEAFRAALRAERNAKRRTRARMRRVGLLVAGFLRDEGIELQGRDD